MSERISNLSPNDLIRLLNLAQHPEGGYFRQTYFKASEGEPKGSERSPLATAIYFLITGNNFSTWHRVPHDEIFHFYAGECVEVFIISPEGHLKKQILGIDLAKQEAPQIIVPGGHWQALRIKAPSSTEAWALLGTTMTPGFEYETFELGKASNLLSEFPKLEEAIQELARE